MNARISPSTINEINKRLDIVSVVGDYMRLQKKGAEWWGCCPFHNEKSPSFHVSSDRNLYHCFGCGVGGSLITFFMEMEKVSFAEAVVTLAKRAGVEVVYEGGVTPIDFSADNKKAEYIDLYKRVAGTFRYFLTSADLGKSALEYMRSRGITEEIAETFMLGYAPMDRYWLKKFLREKNYSNEFLSDSGLFSRNYPDVAFFSDRLMFPICDRKGQVIAFGGRLLAGEGPKYLNSSELPHYKKSETLYAFHLARNEIRTKNEVILCEGYMDVIAYHQAGIKNAVAPLGTALTEDQVRLIKSFSETVILSFDSDGAGKKAAYKAILLCRKAGLTVKIIDFGDNGKDPAEILQNLGADILSKFVENSIIDCDYLLSSLSKTYQIGTPDGKSKAAIAFFPYIDVLQSDIQKESSLELFAQVFNLKLEAVKSDFKNRNSVQKRIEVQDSSTKQNVVKKVKMNAELRTLLAVTANMDYFKLVRTFLTADDFEDTTARDLYIVLEECFREQSSSFDNILMHCTDPVLQKLVTQTVTSGEFAERPELTIQESIRTIKKNSLKKKKDRLVNSLRQWNGVTLEEQQQLTEIQTEVSIIDSQLRSL